MSTKTSSRFRRASLLSSRLLRRLLLVASPLKNKAHLVLESRCTLESEFTKIIDSLSTRLSLRTRVTKEVLPSKPLARKVP